MKSDERSPDVGAWKGGTVSSDPDHGKICSWLIRQIRAELKPCPLIQMGWFLPRHVKGRADIQFVGVKALAHAVGHKTDVRDFQVQHGVTSVYSSNLGYETASRIHGRNVNMTFAQSGTEISGRSSVIHFIEEEPRKSHSAQA
jgi:hypothetical protein